MMPLMMPPLLHDDMLVPVVSHYDKGHVAPHFNSLDLKNAVVPLTMLSASCYADPTVSGIT